MQTEKVLERMRQRLGVPPPRVQIGPRWPITGLHRITAGGPGSGCHGDNCGRPKGSGAEKAQGPKAQAHAHLTSLGFTKLSGQHTFPELKGKTGTGYIHPSMGKVIVESKAFSHVSPVDGKFVKKSIVGPAGLTPLATHLMNVSLSKMENGMPKVTPPVVTPPAPATPKPVEPAKLAQFYKEAGNTLKPEDFTYKAGKSEAGLGGAHDKAVFTKDGKDWMFKPATMLGGAPDRMKALADQVASKVQEIVHPGYAVKAEAISLPMPGKGVQFGSVQQMVPKEMLRGEGGKYQDFTNRDFTKDPLKDWEIAHLQQEHVLDWLISNHDAHGGQFLRTVNSYPGGRGVIGIDKTQAFRYFPNDVLSTSYHPNATYNEKPPIYNQMWKDAKDGKIDVDPRNTLKAIQRVEAIPDEKYKAILKPYADARFGTDETGKATFMDAALDRKQNIRGDFESLLSHVTGTDFKFENQKEHGKEGWVEETYPYPTNPAPKFTQEHTHPELSVMYGHAKEALAKYPANLQSLTAKSMEDWDTAINKTTGYAGVSKMAPEERQSVLEATAKGRGAYAEVAARAGVGPKEMQEVHNGLRSWSFSTSSGEIVGRLRQMAQELVQGKCCSEPLGKALAVEHAMTREKLLKDHPEGYVPLTRAVSGEIATKINEAVKQYPVVNIKLLNADGWSDNKGFSGSARIAGDVHVNHIMSSYKTNKEAWNAHSGEHEYVVAVPGTWQKFDSDELKKSTHSYSGVGCYNGVRGNRKMKKDINAAFEQGQLDKDGVPCFDLTDELNANARDNLRKNPDDPRYKGPPINATMRRWVPPAE